MTLILSRGALNAASSLARTFSEWAMYKSLLVARALKEALGTEERQSHDASGFVHHRIRSSLAACRATTARASRVQAATRNSVDIKHRGRRHDPDARKGA